MATSIFSRPLKLFNNDPFPHQSPGESSTKGQETTIARHPIIVPGVPSAPNSNLQLIDYDKKRKDLLSLDHRGYGILAQISGDSARGAAPYLTRDIGDSTFTSYDSMLIRGGIVLSTRHAIEDTLRLTLFSASAKGVIWHAKQTALQNINPRPETRTYNPTNLLLNSATQHLGIRFTRHSPGIGGISVIPTSPTSRAPSYSTHQDYLKIGDRRGTSFATAPNTSRFDALIQESFVSGKTRDTVSPRDYHSIGSDDFIALRDQAKVHSIYGIPSDRGMARAWNTQIRETQGAEKGIEKSLPSTTLGSYKTLAYGELDVDEFRYIPVNATPGTVLRRGEGKGRTASKTGVTVRPSKMKNRLFIRGFPDAGQGDGADKMQTIPTGVIHDVKETEISTHTSRGKLADDLVSFYFYDITNKTLLPFRATVTGISDTITPTWGERNFIGNPLTFYRYSGTTREVTFDFMIATNSEVELRSNWLRISRLVGLTYPDYDGSGRMISPLIKLTIGDMYTRVLGFLSSLTVTVDENSPWELNMFNNPDLGQLPHVISCNVSFTYIGNEIPSMKSPHYFHKKDEWKRLIPDYGEDIT